MSTLGPIKGQHRRGAGSFDQFNTISAPGIGTSKRGGLSDTQKQLVNFSVRAQDFILKKGMTDRNSNTIDVDDININVGKGGPGDTDWLNDSIGSIKKTKKINGYMESAQTPNAIFQLP